MFLYKMVKFNCNVSSSGDDGKYECLVIKMKVAL